MEELGKIEIRIIGRTGNDDLSPDNFDIREIRNLFDIVENLLYPNKKNPRSPISYSMEKGSVRNIFKTSLQSATAFVAVLNLVNQNGTLEGLELPTARAFQEIQKSAVRNNYIYEFGTPSKAPVLTISSATSFHINEDLWANAEFYFYGVLVNAGGKDRTNIHIETKDWGLLTISTERDFLKGIEHNVLYKHFAVRAIGRQNINSGEIDTSSLMLLELIPFDPNYKEEYLTQLIQRASKNWAEISDADSWISEIRGNNG